MTGSPEEFEDRIRRVLDEAAGQLPVRRLPWRGPSRPRRHPLPRPGGGGIATAFAVVVAVAVVVLALGLLRHSPASAPGGASGPPPARVGIPSHLTVRDRRALQRVFARVRAAETRAGCQPRMTRLPAASLGTPSRGLLSTLGVLRRPGTASDRLAKNLQGLPPDIYLDYVRLARTIGATRYYVVPTRAIQRQSLPKGCAALITATAKRAAASAPSVVRAAVYRTLVADIAVSTSTPQTGEDGVCVVVLGSGSDEFGECSGLGDVELGLPSSLFGGPGAGQVYGVAPDGVATVVIRYKWRAVTARVIGNVFAARVSVPGLSAPGPVAGARVTWLNAHGKVIPHPLPGSVQGAGPSYAFATAQAHASATAARPFQATAAPKHGAFCKQNPTAC